MLKNEILTDRKASSTGIPKIGERSLVREALRSYILFQMLLDEYLKEKKSE